MGFWEVLDSIGYALDTPGALTRGLLSGRPGDRVGGREMLEEWGVLGDNQEGFDWGDVAGFGADVLVDPTNLIPAGMLGKLFKGRKAAQSSQAAHDAVRLQNLDAYDKIDKGFMPFDIAQKTKAVDESGNPIRLYHGTKRAFDTPDLATDGGTNLYGKGFYQTTDPEIASDYAAAEGIEFLMNKGAPGTDDFFARVLDTYETVPPARRPRRATWQPDDTVAMGPATREQADAIARTVMGETWGFDAPTVTEALGIPPDQVRALMQQAPPGVVSQVAPNVRMSHIYSQNPLDLTSQEMPDWLPSVIGERAGDVSLQAGETIEDLLARTRTRNLINFDNIPPYYDAIKHQGGHVFDGPKHDVWVTPEESYIYKPYVAPEIRDAPPVLPSPNGKPAYGALTALLASHGAQTAGGY